MSRRSAPAGSLRDRPQTAVRPRRCGLREFELPARRHPTQAVGCLPRQKFRLSVHRPKGHATWAPQPSHRVRRQLSATQPQARPGSDFARGPVCGVSPPDLQLRVPATRRVGARSTRASASQVLGGLRRWARWWNPKSTPAGSSRIAIAAAWRRCGAHPVAVALEGGSSHGGGRAPSFQVPCAAHGGVRHSTRSDAG